MQAWMIFAAVGGALALATAIGGIWWAAYRIGQMYDDSGEW